MNIVVLDGYTLNPGDLSWGEMEQLGKLTVWDRTPEDRVAERASGAEIVLTNKSVLSADTIKALPDLKYIGILATGYNIVDAEAAAERNIPVCNVPTYGTTAVAQMVFALLLELCHHVQRHSDAVKGGRWSAQPDYCFWDYPLIELAGKTMGIVGFGRIGRQTGKIADALGMTVIAHDPDRDNPPDYPGFKWAELDELLGEADVVSLNCPLTKENGGMINAAALEHMKKSAFLINASRGGLVVDDDLAEALRTGVIAGAAVDVVSNTEPPDPDNPLLYARNCIVTPHIAWAAKESRGRLMKTAVENVKAFRQGTPQNVVNGVE
jgi:glycerate dehydrogenase